MNILNVEKVSKTYGEKQLFDEVTLGVNKGDKIGVIGVNGTGKSTFLKIIAGLEEADAVFMNTCSIRDNAEQKILNRLEFSTR